MSNIKYILNDTFNNRVISRHRSPEAALLKRRSISRHIRRNSGANSYLPMSITVDVSGADVSEEAALDELELAERRLYSEGRI